jgi:hypothetical protein
MKEASSLGGGIYFLNERSLFLRRGHIFLE